MRAIRFGGVLLTVSTLVGVEGFSPFVHTLPCSFAKSSSFVVKAELYFAEETDGKDETQEPVVAASELSIYDRIGFEEDKIAIGIDENELLQWLGNREDLIKRFMEDNKGFDRERAETEVDKFVMDSEMVNAFIQYEKKKSDPKFLREQAEQTISDPGTWATYGLWIVGGAGFAYVKNVIVEPKYASGEWEEIHITFPGAAQISDIASVAATTASDSAVNAVTDTVILGP